MSRAFALILSLTVALPAAGPALAEEPAPPDTEVAGVDAESVKKFLEENPPPKPLGLGEDEPEAALEGRVNVVGLEGS